MPEHRLAPLTALGHPDLVVVTIGPVTIAERTDVALASLAARRGREADVAAAAQAIGLPLPGPGCHATGPVWSAFWLGPGQWMVEADFERFEDIVAALRPAFGIAASITEQTDAWVRFDLAGDDLAAVFERLCALDVRSMQPGHATRTVIEHLGSFVIRGRGGITVLGPRSAAGSLHHALVTALRNAF
ncbi:MAG: sarcosine oxidase subunit gamma [Rhodobacter sp.]|nr:sarcosine oxidase subunit gamma [Rhodobacter sp.]